MKLAKPLFVLTLIAFAFAPTLSHAGDSAPSVSYAAKKKGMVHFQDKADNTVAATADSMEGVHPADIEPAAGGFEVEETATQNSLADRMKLPRKN